MFAITLCYCYIFLFPLDMFYILHYFLSFNNHSYFVLHLKVVDICSLGFMSCYFLLWLLSFRVFLLIILHNLLDFVDDFDEFFLAIFVFTFLSYAMLNDIKFLFLFPLDYLAENQSFGSIPAFSFIEHLFPSIRR